MDCGPACLKSMLQGYNLAVNFGRLRDICQTDVDGTSIDVIEDLMVQLGLPAEQIILPADYISLTCAEVLPAILITALPNNIPHFIVIWRRLGPWVQVMNPGYGRRWIRWSTLLSQVYQHRMDVPGEEWREWAAGNEAELMMRERLHNLGLDAAQADDVWQQLLSDESWRTAAQVDAVVRWTNALQSQGMLKKGPDCRQFLTSQLAKKEIPPEYIKVTGADKEMVTVTIAVLVRVQSERSPVEVKSLTKAADRFGLLEPEIKPLMFFWQWFTQDSALFPIALALISAVAAAIIVLQIVLFDTLLELNRLLGIGSERWGFVAWLLLFLAISTLFHIPFARIKLSLGRRLEIGLRRDLLIKLPLLQHQAIRTRLLSDMAERRHNLHLLRELPVSALNLAETFFLLLFTLIGIAYLYPGSALPSLLLAVLMISAPLLVNGVLGDLDNRTRTLVAIINRLYYDSLRGLLPLRSHVAEQSQVLEQDRFLSQWGRSYRSFNGILLNMQLALELTGLLIVGWILLSFVGAAVPAPSLLLVYWVLNLSLLGEKLGLIILKYPGFRNVLMRYMELLSQPEQTTSLPEAAVGATENGGVAISMTSVSLAVAGNTILHDINLTIAAGEQVAIVGESGAGKSSLLGLLLGRFQQYEGNITTDRQPLNSYSLYPEIVWIDPAVQLWNRSIASNLEYGQRQTSSVHHTDDLLDLITQLPGGIKTIVGEGGCTLSGGEGQRLRIGRGLGHSQPRLVLLDEACRGLDRVTRHDLLDKLRRKWPDATMICITHDITEARLFPRVLVMSNGSIVEDTNPRHAIEGTYFKGLLDQEQEIYQRLTQNTHWHYWNIGHHGLVKTRFKPGE